jgi:hypothetical protein
MITINQIMMFGEFVKMRESLYTQVITQVIAILNHVYTRRVYLDTKIPRLVYRPEWYWKQITKQINDYLIKKTPSENENSYYNGTL